VAERAVSAQSFHPKCSFSIKRGVKTGEKAKNQHQKAGNYSSSLTPFGAFLPKWGANPVD